jgi:hypothetical protein
VATGISRSVKSSAGQILGGDAGPREALEHRWGHDHDADSRHGQASVDLRPERRVERDLRSLNQTVAPFASRRPYRSFAAPARSGQASAEEQVATLRVDARLHLGIRVSGSSVRHCVGVYDTVRLRAVDVCRHRHPPPPPPRRTTHRHRSGTGPRAASRRRPVRGPVAASVPAHGAVGASARRAVSRA